MSNLCSVTTIYNNLYPQILRYQLSNCSFESLCRILSIEKAKNIFNFATNKGCVHRDKTSTKRFVYGVKPFVTECPCVRNRFLTDYNPFCYAERTKFFHVKQGWSPFTCVKHNDIIRVNKIRSLTIFVITEII